MLSHSAISARAVCGLLITTVTTPPYVLALTCSYEPTVVLSCDYVPAIDLRASYDPANQLAAGWEG